LAVRRESEVFYRSTTSPTSLPFDVSFPEKLLKIVAILGYIFALNSPNTYRLYKASNLKK